MAKDWFQLPNFESIKESIRKMLPQTPQSEAPQVEVTSGEVASDEVQSESTPAESASPEPPASEPAAEENHAPENNTELPETLPQANATETTFYDNVVPASYDQAIGSLKKTLDKLEGCTPEEKKRLKLELESMTDMVSKMNTGRVEIVVFGEISTGKSALINALAGKDIAQVDVQGGWTKEIWKIDWDACAYKVPGFGESSVVLLDTPGINEVSGDNRAELAMEAARRADLILFVTDSDLNETEFSALVNLASLHKPMLLVLNKIDLYPPSQRDRLLEVLRDERAVNIIPPKNIIATAADPRETEFMIEGSDGAVRSEWRKPSPRVEDLKVRILEVLAAEGVALMALNGAMYAADKSDRITSLRMQMRSVRANQVIFGYAAVKAVAVALNPYPVVDIVGGAAVDGTMIVTLANIYGLEMSWSHAQGLAISIATTAGGVMAGEMLTHVVASIWKGVTLGAGIPISAIPQAAAAGFGSYVVGQAAKYYFEHGASWGGESPKSVIQKILKETDKESVIAHLKEEINKKLQRNPHAGKTE